MPALAKALVSAADGLGEVKGLMEPRDSTNGLKQFLKDTWHILQVGAVAVLYAMLVLSCMPARPLVDDLLSQYNTSLFRPTEVQMLNFKLQAADLTFCTAGKPAWDLC